jgi:hypothetical protein
VQPLDYWTVRLLLVSKARWKILRISPRCAEFICWSVSAFDAKTREHTAQVATTVLGFQRRSRWRTDFWELLGEVASMVTA